MIEKSIFKNNIEIKDYLKNTYNLIVKKIKKCNRGSANIYLIDNKYVLKEYQSKYTIKDINKEISIINHLKNDGINVPLFIKTIDNKYSNEYKGKVIIIEKFIDGYTINNNEGNYEEVIECANMYGKIVNSLENLNITLSNSNMLITDEIINNGIKKNMGLLPFIKDSKIKKDILDKIDMLNILKGNDYKEMDKLTIKNTHGDYSVQQLIYKDGKINAVIDFASVCKMPVIWEIIRSYSYIDKKFNIDNFIDYVKEILKYIKLNKYDMKYMCILYLVQMLSSTYGYKEYIFRSNDKLLSFAYFRTNLCKYLYKNNDIMVKRLEKLI